MVGVAGWAQALKAANTAPRRVKTRTMPGRKVSVPKVTVIDRRTPESTEGCDVLEIVTTIVLRLARGVPPFRDNALAFSQAQAQRFRFGIMPIRTQPGW